MKTKPTKAPQANLIDDWLEVLDFRTAKDGVSLDFSRRHASRLPIVVGSILNPELRRLIAMANEVLMAEFRRLSPQQIRDWMMRTYREEFQAHRGEVEQAMRSTLLWKEQTGGTLEPSSQAWLHMAPSEASAHIDTLLLSMEAQPLEWWNQLKQEILRVWKELSCYGRDVLPKGELDDVLSAAAWHTQREIARRCDSEPCGWMVPEFKAVVIDREAVNGWGGDRDVAFDVVSSALGRALVNELHARHWSIKGPRFARTETRKESEGPFDTWDNPANDEIQLLQTGLLDGLEWARDKSLSTLKEKATTGELRNTFKRVSKNNLLGEIRRENRRLGIRVPPFQSCEGETEDETRERIDSELRQLKGCEVSDYDIIGPDDGDPTSLLESSSDRRTFAEWRENEPDEEREALITEMVGELCEKARLTPRLQFVADRCALEDDELAAALQERFGKPFSQGAVRQLRHRLFVELREVASSQLQQPKM